jgi:hypothetical protein
MAQIRSRKPHCISHGATFLQVRDHDNLEKKGLHDSLCFRQQGGHSIASHEEDHAAYQDRIYVAWIADLVVNRRDGSILWLNEHR